MGRERKKGTAEEKVDRRGTIHTKYKLLAT